jgi:acyl-CoA hydrolase
MNKTYTIKDLKRIGVMNMEKKYVRESRTVKSSVVLPPDTNNYGTLFGGKLMAYIDDVAAISAIRHARKHVVTASTDSVDFLQPIKEGYSVCLESFVTWTKTTSMEVFVKVIAENLLSGERNVCAVSFLTFVAMGEDGKPTPVPKVIPETEEEKWLHEHAPERAIARKKRREESKRLAKEFGVKKPWETM